MEHTGSLMMSSYPLLLAAFLFGLLGSVGHCAVMCGAVQVLFARRGLTSGWRLGVLHTGRLLTYAALGLVAGALGGAFQRLLPDVALLQGGLALVLALGAGYFALSLISKAPSPELLLAPVTRWWGAVMRRLPGAERAGLLPALATGLLWGALPCGFVLAALIPATAGGTSLNGAAAMLAFGLGTLPILLVVSWLADSPQQVSRAWARPLGALVIGLFGAQMALRGLASWGVVEHLMVAKVMLW